MKRKSMEAFKRTSLNPKMHQKSPCSSPKTPRAIALEKWTKVDESTKLYVNVEQYHFNFNIIMYTQALRDLFTDYLRSIRNEEQIKFLSEVEKFRNIFDEKEKYLKASFIYETYLKPCGDYEINISKSERIKIEGNIKNSSETDCKNSLFDDIYHIIYCNLQLDSFNRFLQSYVFQEFCREINNELFDSFATKK
jgi:hypothetical protein